MNTPGDSGRMLGKKSRILIVDDHPTVRDGIRFQLSRFDDLEICGEAAEEAEAFRLAKASRPDLMIVDISLKSGNGLDLVKQIRQRLPAVKTLVLSIYGETLYAERALRAGARGYLNKQESREHLVAAVRAVLSDQRYLSDAMTQRLLGQAVGHLAPETGSPWDSLSDRELEVFRLIGEGLATSAIAEKLHLSPHTIDSHRERIKLKLGLSDSGQLRREAVHWVLENG